MSEDIFKALNAFIEKMKNPINNIEVYANHGHRIAMLFRYLNMIGKDKFNANIHYVDTRYPVIKLEDTVIWVGEMKGDFVDSLFNVLLLYSRNELAISESVKRINGYRRPIILSVLMSSMCPFCFEACLGLSGMTLAMKRMGVNVKQVNMNVDNMNIEYIVDKYNIEYVPTILINGRKAIEGIPNSQLELQDMVVKMILEQ